MPLEPKIQRFERVKNELTHSIVRGRFSPGDRLPSLRELCKHFQVSLMTVQRAVQELKEEEWLVSTSARNGIRVANPLPPIAHLVRLKNAHRDETPRVHGVIGSRENGILRCLITDEAMVPLFEWAAREYADAYAPYSIRFEVKSIDGRDDEEALRSLDADLVLLSSYAANRAVRVGTVTPAEGLLSHPENRFGDVPAGILDLVSLRGKLWAAPVTVGGPLLVAQESACRNAGLDPATLTSVESVLAGLLAARDGSADGEALFNVTFPLMFVVAAGMEPPDIRQVDEWITQPRMRALLTRIRHVAMRPGAVVTRFDKWESIDFSRIALRHQPSEAFCADARKRRDLRVLAVPGPAEGRVAVAAYGMCVGARSIHPFEAWEWAACLSDVPFQTRLAEMACAVPASAHPSVQAALGRAIGGENAAILQEFLHRPSAFYGMAEEDFMRYVWEVFSNEVYRFLHGENDYDGFVERVKVKTGRFVRRMEAEAATAAPALSDAAVT